MYYTILARNSPISPGEGNVTIAAQCATILKCCRMFCTVFVLLPSQHDADSSSALRKQPFSPNQDVCSSVCMLFLRRLALCAYAPHTRSAGPLSLLKMGTCSSLPGRGRRRRRSGRRRREGIYFWPQVFWKNTPRRRRGGGGNVDKRGITLHPTDPGRAIEVNGCFFELELASALAVGARKWLLFYQSG